MRKTKRGVGIDIGGTKTAIGAVDGTGAIIARTAFPTDAGAGFDQAVERMLAAIDKVVCQAGWSRRDLAGIGVGCPGPVNPLLGTIHNPYTLPTWHNCDIVSPLRGAFGVPAFLENDADAALLGEALAGSARGCSSAVMLTLGTGIGTAILVNGRIYRGCHGEHPEMGHIPIEAGGPDCYCGRKGCLEAVASGEAIGAAGRSVNLPDSRAVFAAAAQGNPAARQVIDRALRATAIAAWTILHTFLPERIVLGGGIADEHYELFAGPFREAIAAATMVPRSHVTVTRAQLGNDAGLVGAASLVLDAGNCES
jgi:glucokinase